MGIYIYLYVCVCYCVRGWSGGCTVEIKHDTGL